MENCAFGKGKREKGKEIEEIIFEIMVHSWIV